MARWFSLDPADSGFFNDGGGASRIFRYETHFDALPERVWESLASDASMSAWGPAISSVTWHTPRPFGIGTTRDVVLAPGLVRVRERFFRWDEGKGYSFYIYQANAPLFRRFAEDYALAPDAGGTRFTWTIAIQPRRAFAIPFLALAPLLKAGFGRVAADGRRFFAKHR